MFCFRSLSWCGSHQLVHPWYRDVKNQIFDLGFFVWLSSSSALYWWELFLPNCFRLCSLICFDHGLINSIDAKAKCHLKKLTCKGTLRKSKSTGNSQSWWYFRPSFVNCGPSSLLWGLTLSPPPFPVWIRKYTVYTYTVCRGGGG